MIPVKVKKVKARAMRSPGDQSGGAAAAKPKEIRNINKPIGKRRRIKTYNIQRDHKLKKKHQRDKNDGPTRDRRRQH